MTEIYADNVAVVRELRTGEHTEHTPDQCKCALKGRDVIYIQNDKNVLKGIFWGILGFNVGSTGVSVGTAALATSPFLFTPLAPIPLSLALLTWGLYNGTVSCAKNTFYHLLPSNVVIVRG